MNAEKQTIVIALSNNTAVHSLLTSGALEELRGQFNLAFIYSDIVNLPVPGGVRIDFFKKRNKYIKFVDYHLWYLTFYKHIRKTRGLKEDYKSYKISMLSKKERAIMTFLSLPVIFEITVFISEKLIIRLSKDIYQHLKKINPELVILPGVPFDSFGLEAVKCANRLSLKSIMVVLNWDFFSSKGLLRANPDIVCVWGQQMYEMCVGPHMIPNEKVKIAGVPQYEIYKKKISMDDARRNIGLPLDKKIWLFAGIGETYDEMSVLKEIDKLIGTELPSDILVLYRPHPKKHPARKNENDFKEYKFKNLALDPESAGTAREAGGTPPGYYANLLYSADAFISPFSTMTLEAAFCGKPYLTIGFSDDLHEWKLEYTVVQDHVKPLLSWKSLFLCLDKKDFCRFLKSLLAVTESADKSAHESKIRKELDYIVYRDNEPYSKKLLNIVMAVRTENKCIKVLR